MSSTLPLGLAPAALPPRRRQVAALLLATALQFLTAAGAWTWAVMRVVADAEHAPDERAGTLRWCIVLVATSVLFAVLAGFGAWRLWKPDPSASQPPLAVFVLAIVVEIVAAGCVVWGLLMATVINEG